MSSEQMKAERGAILDALASIESHLTAIDQKAAKPDRDIFWCMSDELRGIREVIDALLSGRGLAQDIAGKNKTRLHVMTAAMDTSIMREQLGESLVFLRLMIKAWLDRMNEYDIPAVRVSTSDALKNSRSE